MTHFATTTIYTAAWTAIFLDAPEICPVNVSATPTVSRSLSLYYLHLNGDDDGNINNKTGD